MGGTVSIIGSYKENGDRAFKEGMYMEAIFWYSQTIEDAASNSDPVNRGVLYSNRSASYVAINRPDKALADALCCIHLRPTWCKGYYRAAISAKNCGLYDIAIDYVDKAIALSPSPDESLATLRIMCQSNLLESMCAPSLYCWNEDRYNNI